MASIVARASATGVVSVIVTKAAIVARASAPCAKVPVASLALAPGETPREGTEARRPGGATRLVNRQILRSTGAPLSAQKAEYVENDEAERKCERPFSSAMDAGESLLVS